MADKIIEELTRRVEELEKKFYEVNFPYQKPPYPCVVESVSSGWHEYDAFLLSDGQIKFSEDYPYQNSGNGTAPTTLGAMAERAGVDVSPADMKKKTVVTPNIFEKFGGMKWAYMGDFMVSDYGNLYSIEPISPAEMFDKLERDAAKNGLSYTFKVDSSASVWDNVKTAFHAYKVAKDNKYGRAD